MTQTFCSACNGEMELLGVLGVMEHYRCQDCGLEWSRLHPDLADQAEGRS